jgi:hypothetical protein
MVAFDFSKNIYLDCLSTFYTVVYFYNLYDFTLQSRNLFSQSGISWLTERLLASEEGLCTMELNLCIIYLVLGMKDLRQTYWLQPYLQEHEGSDAVTRKFVICLCGWLVGCLFILVLGRHEI